MRSIPDPGFPGDDGSVPVEVQRALATYDTDPDRLHHATLSVLQRARVLVPVVAVLDEAEDGEDGIPRDKNSHMAVVLMTGADGARALLAFSGSGPLQRWDPAARPVPVTLADAARAAQHDGARALVLDVAGPVLFAVDGADLAALAEGRRLVRVGEHWAWAPAG